MLLLGQRLELQLHWKDADKMGEKDSIENLTEYFNKPRNKDWIQYCKSDLSFYCKIQFGIPLDLIRTADLMLKELDILIKSEEVDKKEVYDLIRFEILLGFKKIKKCREALFFLVEKKYFKQKRIKSFSKEITDIENNLYVYTKKFANMAVSCPN